MEYYQYGVLLFIGTLTFSMVKEYVEVVYAHYKRVKVEEEVEVEVEVKEE